MMHLALLTFLSTTLPALALIAGFVWRTRVQVFSLMPAVQQVSIAEVETKRMRSVR